MDQNLITREYRQRVAVVALTATLVLLFMSLALMFPTYLDLTEKKEVAAARYQEFSHSGTVEETAELSALLKNTERQLNVLAPRGKHETISELIVRLIERKPAGVRLTGFTATRQNDASWQLYLEGEARGREDLLRFFQALREAPALSDVELPVSHFAKGENLMFSLKATWEP